MSRQLEAYKFNPRLIIVNHFDEIINKIDVKTEISLEKLEVSHIKRKLEAATSHVESEKQNVLNEAREKQIAMIKIIQEINLNFLNDKAIEEFEEKWSHVIQDDSLDYQQKMDQIKAELIHNDCVLLEQSQLKDTISLILWITSCYYNKKDLDFLK